MFTSIITDCRDENAMNRQAVRAMHFFQSPVSTLGIANDFEAAGNLIDALDASQGEHGVVMVNVAPRHGLGRKWPNGTPFGYFTYKQTLVLSTIDGQCLSLAKKFGVTDAIQVTDVPTIVDHMISLGKLDASLRDHIVDSQFRSYEYMPRVAKWLLEGEEVPAERYELANVVDIPLSVWWIDNFGNCKTTLLTSDADYVPGQNLQTKFGAIPCYRRLKDVPVNEPGIIVGSSGLDSRRFLELVIKGQSAAARFGLKTGDSILL